MTRRSDIIKIFVVAAVLGAVVLLSSALRFILATKHLISATSLIPPSSPRHRAVWYRR
jgi:hypothetical protein